MEDFDQTARMRRLVCADAQADLVLGYPHQLLGRFWQCDRFSHDMAVINAFQVNGFTFRGKHCVIFILPPLSMGGQLLKERICSYWSKFFPVRLDAILDGFVF